MNVLITGGYGFIGSHVAERFCKEGYRVYIIDNLTSGNVKNIKFKHTFFQLDVEDNKCKEIFKRNKFDVVVHLAAQINVAISIEDPYQDTKSNILGLTNMLQLASQYGVKKFVFSSSAAVYGNNGKVNLAEEAELEPVSPYGMSKLTGELYCRKWNELFGLDTICFRFSNVYGPRQGIVGEGGVVSIFLERMMKEEELIIFGDGNQTRDFIYVKDVAEAIYLSIGVNASGIFNLSTKTENSVNGLVNILSTFAPIKEVFYQEAREGDIKNSCLDNTKIKNLLNWSPRYNFEEGLKSTYIWHAEQYKGRLKQETDKKRKSKNLVKNLLASSKSKSVVLPYLENFLFFLVVCLLTLTTPKTTSYYVLDYKLIYIVVIAAVYGMKQGIIASMLSCSIYIYLYLNKGSDIFSLVNDTNSLLQLSFYILAGIVLGYIIDRKNNQIQARDNLLQASEEKYIFLNDICDKIFMVKEELCQQVISSQDSYGKVYSMIMELDNLVPIEIFTRAIKILENVMQSDKASIYTLSDNKSIAILAAKSEQMDFIVPSVLKIRERVDIQKVIDTGEIFINKKFLPDLPVMTAPIMDGEDIIAIASIHSMDFENLTLHKHNVLKVTVNLIAYSLSHAYRYSEGALNEQIHYPKVGNIG